MNLTKLLIGGASSILYFYFWTGLVLAILLIIQKPVRSDSKGRLAIIVLFLPLIFQIIWSVFFSIFRNADISTYVGITTTALFGYLPYIIGPILAFRLSSRTPEIRWRKWIRALSILTPILLVVLGGALYIFALFVAGLN